MWKWPQTEPFDLERYWPIYFACVDHFGAFEVLQGIVAPHRIAAKPVFFPHDGIKPFWMLERDAQTAESTAKG